MVCEALQLVSVVRVCDVSAHCPSNQHTHTHSTHKQHIHTATNTHTHTHTHNCGCVHGCSSPPLPAGSLKPSSAQGERVEPSAPLTLVPALVQTLRPHTTLVQLHVKGGPRNGFRGWRGPCRARAARPAAEVPTLSTSRHFAMDCPST